MPIALQTLQQEILAQHSKPLTLDYAITINCHGNYSGGGQSTHQTSQCWPDTAGSCLQGTLSLDTQRWCAPKTHQTTADQTRRKYPSN